MSQLRRRMIEDMQLHGLSAKTRQCYADAVKHLSRHYGRSPDRLGEQEIRQYFLHLVNERHVAESTFRIHFYGIKFFCEKTLGRPWPVFDVIRPRRSKRLPVVLSREEVRRVLGRVENATIPPQTPAAVEPVPIAARGFSCAWARSRAGKGPRHDRLPLGRIHVLACLQRKAPPTALRQTPAMAVQTKRHRFRPLPPT